MSDQLSLTSVTWPDLIDGICVVVFVMFARWALEIGNRNRPRPL